MHAENRQRIDRWLWHARLVRTRGAAAELAGAGYVRVNGARIAAPSRQVRTGDTAGAIHTQNRGLELALLLTLPAAVALAVLARPILATLFQFGAFVGPMQPGRDEDENVSPLHTLCL